MRIEQASSFHHLLLLLLISCSFFQYYYSQGCHEEERRALLQIKDSMDPIYVQDQLYNWVGKDCCEWDRIECNNSSSRVVGLYLYHVKNWDHEVGLNWWYSLNATLFNNLKKVRWLDLSDNRMDGNGTELLQAICGLSSLETLDLSYNILEGIIHPCLGSMQDLERLDLSHNLFKGNLPLNLGNMKSIRVLLLSNNQFQGHLPPNLGNMSSISTLDLSVNQFQGSIPSHLFKNLSFLQDFDISDNLFVGIFSFSLFSNLTNLDSLDLSNNINLEVETESPSWVSSFQLSILTLSNCNLNKRSGNILPTFLSNQSRLEMLDLSHNSLTGSIPESYTRLRILDLSNNNLTGEISHGLTANTSSLVYLALSNNKLGGDILGKDSKMTKLRYLKLQNNRFTGFVPHILSNCPVLILLDLGHNFLSGDISSSLPALPRLRAFLLGGNHFKGKIPKTLCEMKILQFIDLSGNNFSGEIPSCLNNIMFMPNQSLQSNETMYYNSFPSYFPLQTIRDFITTTGTLMYPYGDSRNSFMSGIDMSCNQLTGSIPPEVGDLRNLHALNLSNNRLTGWLPAFFKNMKNLRSLDLSHNKLSGTIPLDQPHSLFAFNVAFNNLSGKIPSGLISTFTQSSFAGNVGLCGRPTARICSINSTSLVDRQQEETVPLIAKPFFFYSWLAFSYVLGFWYVIAVLIFNRKWQCKFFKTVDKYTDMCQEKFSRCLN